VIQPIMFLLLFTYVFGGAIGSSIPPAAGGKYINFLLPGLLVQISLFGATQTAVGLTDDLSRGVVDRFRSLPMTRSAVLAGRTLADLMRNTVVLAIMFIVAFVIGFRYQTSFLAFLGGVAIVLLFAYAMSWVMAVIGLKVVNPEATQTVTFLVVFPFVFASAVFVPVSTMPSWLQPFAEHQPVTVMVEAARGLMLGAGALQPGQTVAGVVALAIGWCVVITAVAAPWAVRIYRRTTRS
jgi:ABC transporter DrrB family efflux protein